VWPLKAFRSQKSNALEKTKRAIRGNPIRMLLLLPTVLTLAKEVPFTEESPGTKILLVFSNYDSFSWWGFSNMHV
jgi:hypothetical protein